MTQARRVARYLANEEDVGEFLGLVERASTLSDKSKFKEQGKGYE